MPYLMIIVNVNFTNIGNFLIPVAIKNSFGTILLIEFHCVTSLKDNRLLVVNKIRTTKIIKQHVSHIQEQIKI